MREPGYYWVKVHEDSDWEPAEYNTSLLKEPCWLTPGWEVPYRKVFMVGSKMEPPE